MTEAGGAPRVKVWDRFVRTYHWSQAALIAASWLTADDWKWAHERLGYLLAALLAARIAWGFVGPRNARFASFVRPPSEVFSYLGDVRHGHARRYLGHNPAGGAMIVALMTVIAATLLTGWLQTTDIFWGSEAMAELHEGLAVLILVLVAVHLFGVIADSFRHRENLVRAMIDGYRRS
ncbi:cytochrome b/b6 domain-containing protein [Pseudooceanicola sp. LIPI14-2-Ac024]|uniref:cytochrome b/b6 domain-containing protein n=1 Tax=Pseudooceanicola sp. LIPI14-2-Ac024 TaxID=3344875 RepID=UPI0035CF18CA